LSNELVDSWARRLNQYASQRTTELVHAHPAVNNKMGMLKLSQIFRLIKS